MKNAKWVVLAIAAGMIVATAAWLREFRKQPHLGAPGVRIVPVQLYDESGRVAATNSVQMPADVLGIPALPLQRSPISMTELTGLPQDTTFGRRIYAATNDPFAVQISVVLMGTDHTSIHQPQYCLYAQNWSITNTERVSILMDAPYADIPAVKMIASQSFNGRTTDCIYVYWFVSGDKITSEEGSRLFSIWKTVLEKGEMERWAYVSYFVSCVPGTESATYERLKKFIRASVPVFQIVQGNRPQTVAGLSTTK